MAIALEKETLAENDARVALFAAEMSHRLDAGARDGVADVVHAADGTGALASIPRPILDDAAQWLGGPPQYPLALMIGDSPDCRKLAWRIANEFANSWPAVWSNHSTEPVAPLGTWWSH